MSGEKAFLFLQGPSSPLFAKIAEHLTRAGHACYRINLNVGDQIFWRRGGASNYRGSFDKWGSYIRSFMDDRNIGTIILLGEERPYHKEVVRAAKERGVEVVVIEMGYLRPDWVAVELDGMSSNSRFPSDPEVILRAAENLPEPDWIQKYSQTFSSEAFCDLAYYLPTFLLGFLYPHYKVHGIFHPLREYIGWIGRLVTERRRHQEALSQIEHLRAVKTARFVCPLQLETDYQLRAHSPFVSQAEAIAAVIGSFAGSAPSSNVLVFKVHPLDNGLISWNKIITFNAAKYGIKDRVMFVDGGPLESLMDGSQGLVTINSTAALAALRQGLPTKVLGVAIFDIPGLTDPKSLDAFWVSPSVPNARISDAFFKLLAASLHERGNFYSTAGVNAAAYAIGERLLNDSVNAPGGDAGHAPRTRPVKRDRDDCHKRVG